MIFRTLNTYTDILKHFITFELFFHLFSIFDVGHSRHNMASLQPVFAMVLLVTLMLTSAPSAWAVSCSECSRNYSSCNSSCSTDYYDCKRNTRYITDCIRAQTRCYRSCNSAADSCYSRCT